MTEEPNEYGIETHHRQTVEILLSPNSAKLKTTANSRRNFKSLLRGNSRMKRISSKGVRPVRPLKKPTCSVGVKSSPVQWLQNSGQTQPSATELKLGARTKTQSWHVTARKSQEQIAESSMPILRIAKGRKRSAPAPKQGWLRKGRKSLVQIAESLMPILRIAKGRKRSVPARKQRLAKRRSKESGANRRKLDADTTYRKGPETLLASAEAILASARAAEANAAEAVRRAEAIERRANVGRIEAEALERTANAEFTSGARTRSERARARESRSVAFKNYASVLSGPAQLIGFLGVLYGFARYVFFQNFSEESCGRKIKTLDTMVSRVFFFP
jgi:hypothetical protein